MTGSYPLDGQGNRLTMDWEKMSKSKHNGVDPEDVLRQHGVDTTRLCILGGVAPKSDRNWSDEREWCYSLALRYGFVS